MPFKSNEYSWKDLSVVMGGRKVTGIIEVEYGVQRKVTDVYASGSKAHSRVKGNKVFTGKIKLLQSEVIALEEAAISKYGRGTDITDLDFDIICLYANRINGIIDPTARIKTDVLQSCCVTEYNKKLSADDTHMEVELNIMISDIDFGS